MSTGYDVYLFPQALDALGDAIKPFLKEGPGGVHISCRELDTSGMLAELTVALAGENGQSGDVELMLPGSMIRLVMSQVAAQAAFGFAKREPVSAAGTPSNPPSAGH